MISVAPALQLERVSCRYGHGPLVVEPTTLSLEPERCLCLLGPSGCGKTTLLRAIGGYLPVAGGEVRLAGRRVTDDGPERRRIGMVFQNYALFPHLSVRRNVAFGLDVRGVRGRERDERVEGELRRVELDRSLWDRKPRRLSGGQQQRVALARALATRPDLLLLDEPLANLDRGLRVTLRSEIRRIQRSAGVAAVWVTHDQEEALMLADEVGLMHAGRLVQLGPPSVVYEQPRTPFVAGFVGDANLIQVVDRDGHHAVLRGGLRLAVDADWPTPVGRPVLLRPEHLALGPGAHALETVWRGAVETIDYLGADCVVRLATTGVGGVVVRLTVRTPARAIDAVTVGDVIDCGVRTRRPWVVPDDDDGSLAVPLDGPEAGLRAPMRRRARS